MRFRLQALCDARMINTWSGVRSWKYGYARFNYGIRLTGIKKGIPLNPNLLLTLNLIP